MKRKVTFKEAGHCIAPLKRKTHLCTRVVCRMAALSSCWFVFWCHSIGPGEETEIT